MKKELIIIGAHCPDNERLELLSNCVNSMQKLRDDFDILICSHTHIPSNISSKVDYTFLDNNNEYSTELYRRNLSVITFGETVVTSCYVNNQNYYLAVYRLVTTGFGLAKLYGYDKAHYMEYDMLVGEKSEFIENSELLNSYGAVLYKGSRDSKLYDHPFAYGILQSIRVDKMSNDICGFNRDRLLDILDNSLYKTNEPISESIHMSNDMGVYYKDISNLLDNKFEILLSENTKKENRVHWLVPFYNTETNNVDFLAYNNLDRDVDVSVISNGVCLFNKTMSSQTWNMFPLGDINTDYRIKILYDNTFKSDIIIDRNNLEEFKVFSYSQNIKNFK